MEEEREGDLWEEGGEAEVVVVLVEAETDLMMTTIAAVKKAAWVASGGETAVPEGAAVEEVEDGVEVLLAEVEEQGPRRLLVQREAVLAGERDSPVESIRGLRPAVVEAAPLERSLGESEETPSRTPVCLH